MSITTDNNTTDNPSTAFKQPGIATLMAISNLSQILSDLDDHGVPEEFAEGVVTAILHEATEIVNWLMGMTEDLGTVELRFRPPGSSAESKAILN